MYKHILIPLDHSNADETILSHIEALAKFCSSQLSFIHVADGFGARYQKTLNLHDSAEIHDDQIYLKRIQERFSKQGFSAQVHLGRGDPTQEILRYAEKENCDLIAMGTHGHGIFKDFLLGSVAENLRHKTSIPVLLIRIPR